MRAVALAGLEEPYNQERPFAHVLMEYHLLSNIFVPHQITSFHDEILRTVPVGYFHGVQPGTA